MQCSILRARRANANAAAPGFPPAGAMPSSGKPRQGSRWGRAYSEPMFSRVLRLLGWLILGALITWWSRLRAHSKLPPPEGRWREISDNGLA